MDNAQNQLIERLKTANNVLISVSRDPSVDQLAALLGLTLALNKFNKHAAAVFSGNVPSTIEFLKPEDTFEKNTDSLRDFIIALDKSKADKLRYKVENDVVRIFITPYKTSISQDDLDFSQGDFNVDVVIALGVQRQEDLDEAIVAHGRILHDATVTSINLTPPAGDGLGSINWSEPAASSLSELATVLIQAIDAKLLDEQIATALMTGIVAETARFSNEKTTAITMSVSAALMSAGANQQLVASKLETQPEPTNSKGSDTSDDSADDTSSVDESEKSDDGTLKIEHQPGERHSDELSSDNDQTEPAAEAETPQTEPELEISEDTPTVEPVAETDEQPEAVAEAEETETTTPDANTSRPLITEPPTLGSALSANTQIEPLDPVTDPLSLAEAEAPELLDHSSTTVAADNAIISPPEVDHANEDSTTPANGSISPPEPEANHDDQTSVDPMTSSIPTMTPPPDGWQPPAAPQPVQPLVPITPDPQLPPINQDAPAVEDITVEPLPNQPEPTPASDNQPITPLSNATDPLLPPAASETNDMNTLSDIEASVHSPHLDQNPAADLDTARNEVNQALNSAEESQPITPIDALNAQPLGDELHASQTEDQLLSPAPAPTAEPPAGNPLLASLLDNDQAASPVMPTEPPLQAQAVEPPSQPVEPAVDPVQPTVFNPADFSEPLVADTAPQVIDSTAPPPVPPPLPPQFSMPNGQTPQN